MYKVDCEMNADLFYKIVTEELLPDIREKMVDFDLVYVQMDGARPDVLHDGTIYREMEQREDSFAASRHCA